MEFPGRDLIKIQYWISITKSRSKQHRESIWPWVQQVGYHRGGWYIDTWWDKFEQKYFWPMVVPKEARGTFKPAVNEILEEYQNLRQGEIVPDGPPGSAYYEVKELRENRLLLLYATAHFKYIAPRFVYKTRFAPTGAFCWAFILQDIGVERTRLISWWRVEACPKAYFYFMKPFLWFIDGLHQRAILKGIKKRVEGSKT